MRLHPTPRRDRRNSTPRRATARRCRLGCEGLEARLVLSAMPTRVNLPVVGLGAAAAEVSAVPAALSAPRVNVPVTASAQAAAAIVAVPAATTVATASASASTGSSGAALADPTLVTLDLKPLDVNLLGLQVQTSEITVTVAAQPGSGDLLGNILTDAANLLNLQGVSTALNNVLGSVVTLANSASLGYNGTLGSGSLSNAATSTTPVLDVHVAPVNLDLLGAIVKTSPIDLTITAHAGPGLVLGNIVTDLANLLNTPPKGDQLTINYVIDRLDHLLNELNAQLPGVTAATSTATTTTGAGTTTGTTPVLSLSVPPIDLNLLGLVLKTDQITVNADAQAGNGDLLGNLLTDLLHTLHATPSNITTLNSDVNAVLAKVIGVLNNTTLTLPSGALNTLTPVLQSLSVPNLVNTSGTSATAPVLNLDIASQTSSAPPVDVNLLGLVVTTGNINAQLVAQTGNGQVLGNLVYNVSHLLDPGGSLNLLTILGQLGL